MADEKSPTWKYVAITALSIAGILSAGVISDTRIQLAKKADASDVDVVNQRMTSISQRMANLEQEVKIINDKEDFIIMLHINKDGSVPQMPRR